MCRLTRALFVLLLAGGALVGRAERLPVETFVQPKAVSRISLSRDGAYFAYVGESKDSEDVFIGRVDAKGKIIQVEFPSTGPRYYGWIRSLDWISTKRLVIGTNGGMVAIDRDGAKMLPLAGWRRSEERSREGLQLMVHGVIHSSRIRDSDEVLLNEYNRPVESSPSGFIYLQQPNVVRMDTRTGTFTREVENPGDVFSWMADASGVVRVGLALRKGQTTLIYRESTQSGWHDLSGLSTDPDDWTILGKNSTCSKLYLSKMASNGLAAVYTYDLKAGRLETPILRDEVYDLHSWNGARLIETYNGEHLLGFRYEGDIPRTHWFDETYARLQRQVDASLREAVNTFEDFSEDEQIVLIKSSSARNPGSYYILDRSKSTLNKLADVMPGLPVEKLAEMRPLQFSARDGLRLHGYITVPLGREMKNLPLVVMPHDGPGHRDTYEYDPYVQFLANRGYAVLQINYRGSIGLGQSVRKKGYKAMGTTIQDDIEDAARWVIKQGIADPKRVAIVGEGFGGYSALMGLIRSPDLYRCGVSIGGVTDWISYLKNEAEMRASIYEYNLKFWGDPRTDAEMFRAISPVNLADKIQSPLLIIHGRDDPDMPFAQIKAFTKALDKAGRSYELLAKYNEAHRFSSYDSRVELFKRLETFLAKHMPADSPAIAGNH